MQGSENNSFFSSLILEATPAGPDYPSETFICSNYESSDYRIYINHVKTLKFSTSITNFPQSFTFQLCAFTPYDIAGLVTGTERNMLNSFSEKIETNLSKINSHEENNSNPHEVTLSQIGAAAE